MSKTEDLKELCGDFYGAPTNAPFARMHDGKRYTVATDGKGLLAVRGLRCANANGPKPFMHKTTWEAPAPVNLAKLRAFFRKRREVHSERFRKMEPVEILGFVVDARIVRRYLLSWLKTGAGTIRRAPIRGLTTDGHALRIDGPNWFVIVAGTLLETSAARAKWEASC